MNRDGLIGEYFFNGDASDTSGGGHHGVVRGATLTANRFGDPDSAFHFDGVDDYISIDPPPPLNKEAFSVSVWARFDERDMQGWTNCIIAQDDGRDDNPARRVFQLSTFNGRIVWHRMILERDPLCRPRVRRDRWIHIVAIYENGAHRIYLDGQLQDSVHDKFWTHASQPIHIGRKGTDEKSFFFRGDIDDVRLFNRALADPEIHELCTEGGWQPVRAHSKVTEPGQPISGNWGQRGVVLLNLRCDSAGTVTGRIMARDPGYMAPVSRGTFDIATNWLRLEGTARHPDNGTPVPYRIEGLLDGEEVVVTARFELGREVYTGTFILTQAGARGGWWKNSYLNWRFRKLLARISRP